MKRLVGLVGGLLVTLVLLAPVARAADPFGHDGRILVSTRGDITLPAGEHADAVVVVDGTATILGEVNTLVVVDGTASLVGARAETIVAIRSPIEIGPGTVVQGDVMTHESLVHQTGDAEVQGRVTDIATVLIGIGVVLAPALILLWVGFGLATIVAGLLLVGLAPRQVRQAEAVITAEPVLVLVTGIVGVIALPIAGILLIITVIGAPLGLGLLLGLLPLMAFVGYLVAGVWIGDWVLRRSSPERLHERPYLAAVVGVLILEVVGILPVLAIAMAIASLFGFGAVIVLALRALRSSGLSQPTAPGTLPAPMAG
jgi:hypothetical protein